LGPIKIADALEQLLSPPQRGRLAKVIESIGNYKSKFCNDIYFSALLKLKYCRSKIVSVTICPDNMLA
jgi:hypothetical protein